MQARASVSRSQRFKKVQPALRAGGGERGEVVVAELGADGVPVLVVGAGVVDADPGGGRQARPQHVAGLGKERLLAGVQQADHLALGDGEAQAGELRHQARHGDLTLVVLVQPEAAQLRPEVADDPGRHRPMTVRPSGVNQRSRRRRMTCGRSIKSWTRKSS
jgi:hypothetical protein